MDNLELLKKDWNNDSERFKNYSEQELFRMLRKNSASVSRTLLAIGVIEVVLWSCFFYLDADEKEGLFNWLFAFRTIFFSGLIGSLIYFYFKIKNESNVKELMKQIINLRKIILGYIILLFASFIIFNLIDINHNVNDVIRGFVDGWNSGQDNGKKMEIKDINYQTALFGFLFLLAIGLGILSFIYYVVYGSLLDKLKANYTELSKLEDDET